MIHRHTGGLENTRKQQIHIRSIHRHTGGLEKSQSAPQNRISIHRHTGGLEKLTFTQLAMGGYSPPHRRLRN